VRAAAVGVWLDMQLHTRADGWAALSGLWWGVGWRCAAVGRARTCAAVAVVECVVGWAGRGGAGGQGRVLQHALRWCGGVRGVAGAWSIDPVAAVVLWVCCVYALVQQFSNMQRTCFLHAHAAAGGCVAPHSSSPGCTQPAAHARPADGVSLPARPTAGQGFWSLLLCMQRHCAQHALASALVLGWPQPGLPGVRACLPSLAAVACRLSCTVCVTQRVA
jgi:hypothetical protein